ncbi:MAG: hypothetical protein HC945_00890 [Nitrosarchaeum sp.]|nr:hypothetical protein [Nitrosarchaeum sp.]
MRSTISPRQTLYLEEDLTRFKAKQAKKRLEQVTSKANVKAFHEQILENNVYLLKADIVFDCAQDNSITEMIAKQCKQEKTPLIIVRTTGLTYTVLASTKQIPPKTLQTLPLPNYSEEGIHGITTHAAASTAVSEAYKIILGQKNAHIIIGNAWTGSTKASKF